MSNQTMYLNLNYRLICDIVKNKSNFYKRRNFITNSSLVYTLNEKHDAKSVRQIGRGKTNTLTSIKRPREYVNRIKNSENNCLLSWPTA